ncbi:MAG: DUF3179 domain-containing protein [Candidatus Brocadiae bacterium]|nr:DUF3179 domain-containing protein [Candidatus Brocadiia bacterium]
MNDETADRPEEDAPPAQPEQEAAAETEPAPVPTDFRRNFWLLAIILGVVVFAWILTVLWKRVPEGMEDLPPTGAMRPPPPPVQQRPVPRPAPVTVSRVIGSASEVILASPARSLQPGGVAYRLGRLFDITQRTAAFRAEDLIRVPGRWADQREGLVEGRPPGLKFQPAGEVAPMEPLNRVVVVSAGEEVRAYPARILLAYGGVCDRIADVPVFVCWSGATQAARCWVARIDEREVEWRDAGLVYAGNDVYYDAETGSLWDLFSGVAIAGPAAGRSANPMPTTVWPWEEWKAQHPSALVLTTGLDKLGGRGLQVQRAIDFYLQSHQLPFELEHFRPDTSPLPAKTFILGVAMEGEARAYPLARLVGDGIEIVTDAVGGKAVQVHVTSSRTAYATSDGQTLNAPVMLWFAWQEAYPETDVYEVEPQDSAVPTSPDAPQ